MTDSRCPTCGRNYERLAMHWNRSDCQYEQFSPVQWQMLQGLLMGDADIHGRSDTNPHFRVRMTNRPFLEYLDEQLGVLSKGLYLARDAEEQYRNAKSNQQQGISGFESVNRANYEDLWGLRTCSHPALREFEKWYDGSQKRFPKTLELTSQCCRMWYVCDGWLVVERNASPRVMFKSSTRRTGLVFW